MLALWSILSSGGKNRQNMWAVYDVSRLYVKGKVKPGREGGRVELALFSMACYSLGVILCTEVYKSRGVCSKMVRMLLTSGMPVLLAFLALHLQCISLFGGIPAQWKGSKCIRTPLLCLEEDAWYFGCPFLWLTELGANHTYSLQLKYSYIFLVFVFNSW